MTNRIGMLAVVGCVLACAAAAPAPPLVGKVERAADVCVYGATPGGILAAVAIKRAGSSVLVVEPSRWAGGMLGAGLKPMQDCPNFAAVGGLTRRLLLTLGDPEWNGNTLVRASLSRASPKALREEFSALLRERDIPVVYAHRAAACENAGRRIGAAVFDFAPPDDTGCPPAEPRVRGALRVAARVFIDASYEGDLMALAGVSFRVGREAAAEYGEPFAGVQPPMEAAPIDPFVEPGRPESGLLKWVEDDHGRPIGAADDYTQAYNFRFYTTDDPAVRAPLTPPPGYRPMDFELVGRYVEWLVRTVPDETALLARLARIFPGWANSGDWNYHRETLFSIAPLGVSREYATGDWAARARIWKLHQDYLRGLHAFLSSDARVPEAFRRRTAALGLDLRHFPETAGWPPQLYVRVARRLNGRYTITAHDIYAATNMPDSVGLAQYGIDTYPARRIWFRRDGQTWVAIEGKMFVGGARGPTGVPYPVPYRAITPRDEECENLLVPVCFSASHLGYASARMEPVFMICGESAGIAAVRALVENAAVQSIDMTAYRRALKAAGQKLDWDGPRPAAGGAAAAPFTMAALLAECDRDGDGRVSRAEWADGKPGWAWVFPVIDANRDGWIDAAEYAGFQEYKARNPDWARRRPPE